MLFLLLFILGGMAGAALGATQSRMVPPPSEWPVTEKMKMTIYEEYRIRCSYGRC